MFIPLHDDTPLRVIRFQWVTLALLVINIGIFLFTGAFRSDVMQSDLAVGFGLVPVEMFNTFAGVPHGGPVPEVITLFTYPFFHGGWVHLIGNMLFLWVFADNVEDAYGPVSFVVFYFICAVAGGLLHLVMMPQSDLPLIGASGAVSGVLAAYVLLFPRARVWILLFMRVPVPLPAIWVLGGWFVLQVISLVMSKPGENVALWAHIGGFGAGLLVTLMVRPYLFGARGRIHPGRRRGGI